MIGHLLCNGDSDLEESAHLVLGGIWQSLRDGVPEYVLELPYNARFSALPCKHSFLPHHLKNYVQILSSSLRASYLSPDGSYRSNAGWISKSGL